MSTLLLTGAAGGVALLILTARRPALACALLALAIPLTAGMARGAVVPLLRVNEALLLVVAAGLLVHHLFRWRAQAYRGLDLVVLGFCAVNVVVPWAVILLSGADAALDDWLLVLAPIQYLVVYLVYSRTEFTPADLRLFFNVCMLASIPVAAVAAAEALNIGGVRDLLAGYYPKAPQPSWDRVYRPASLLGHYSAVGACGLLNLLLALALAATRQPGFPRCWLSLVVGANLLSMVASETYAPLAVLPVGAVAVLLVVRRVPWSALAAGLPVLGAAAVALWPSVSGRVGAQFGGAGGGIALPETMQTRIDYWQAFFIPALLNHGPWLGTGTLIPAEVPHSLVDFVDNGYLWELFRAGVPGLAMLVVMLVAVAAAAWATRISEDPSIRVLGAVCLGGVVSVVLLDTTSEYLTFTGVSQEFWMFTGLLSGAVVAARSAAAAPGARRSTAPAARGVRPGPLPVGGRIRVNELPGAVHANGALAAELVPVVRIDRQAGRPPGLRAVLGRLGPEGMLVRASAAVLAGFGLARAKPASTAADARTSIPSGPSRPRTARRPGGRPACRSIRTTGTSSAARAPFAWTAPGSSFTRIRPPTGRGPGRTPRAAGAVDLRAPGAAAADRAATTAPDSSPVNIQNSWLTPVKVRYSDVVSSRTTLTTAPRQTAPRTRIDGSSLILVAHAAAATATSMTTSIARPGTPARKSSQR